MSIEAGTRSEQHPSNQIDPAENVLSENDPKLKQVIGTFLYLERGYLDKDDKRDIALASREARKRLRVANVVATAVAEARSQGWQPPKSDRPKSSFERKARQANRAKEKKKHKK